MKKITKVLNILCSLVIIATLSSSAFANESLNNVTKTGKLRIGFCAQYPPFESYNESLGKFEGFDVDLAKAIAKELNLEVVYTDSEWQGLLGGLKKGDFDVIMSCMTKSEARGKEVSLSDTYYLLNQVIVVRKDETQIKNIDDLKDKVVGVQMGSGSEIVVDKITNHFKEVRKFNYNPEAFADLKFKRIDAVVVGMPYTVIQIKKDPSYKIIGEPVGTAETVAVLDKGSQKLTEAINSALKTLKENGTYQAIENKWLSVSTQ